MISPTRQRRQAQILEDEKLARSLAEGSPHRSTRSPACKSSGAVHISPDISVNAGSGSDRQPMEEKRVNQKRMVQWQLGYPETADISDDEQDSLSRAAGGMRLLPELRLQIAQLQNSGWDVVRIRSRQHTPQHGRCTSDVIWADTFDVVSIRPMLGRRHSSSITVIFESTDLSLPPDLALPSPPDIGSNQQKSMLEAYQKFALNDPHSLSRLLDAYAPPVEDSVDHRPLVLAAASAASACFTPVAGRSEDPNGAVSPTTTSSDFASGAVSSTSPPLPPQGAPIATATTRSCSPSLSTQLAPGDIGAVSTTIAGKQLQVAALATKCAAKGDAVSVAAPEIVKSPELPAHATKRKSPGDSEVATIAKLGQPRRAVAQAMEPMCHGETEAVAATTDGKPSEVSTRAARRTSTGHAEVVTSTEFGKLAGVAVQAMESPAQREVGAAASPSDCTPTEVDTHASQPTFFGARLPSSEQPERKSDVPRVRLSGAASPNRRAVAKTTQAGFPLRIPHTVTTLLKRKRLERSQDFVKGRQTLADVLSKLFVKMDSDAKDSLHAFDIEATLVVLQDHEQASFADTLQKIFDGAKFEHDEYIMRAEWEKYSTSVQDHTGNILQTLSQIVEGLDFDRVRTLARKQMVKQLPPGWKCIPSISRPGLYTYQNTHLSIRVASRDEAWKKYQQAERTAARQRNVIAVRTALSSLE